MNDMAAVLLITLRRGIWRVTKDGIFFGDYPSKRSATEGAEAAATILKRAGRAVKILIVPVQKEK
jgi:hypothetical protein